MIRVGAFTGGRAVPSARFRVRQYIPALRDSGISVEESYPRVTSFPPCGKLMRPLWAIASLAERIPSITRSHRLDAVLLQREMLSTFRTLEPLTRAPRIFDVDDAIFLYRGGRFARHLAEISECVICGNTYIADWFSSWNRNVCVIPTAVDTDTYRPVQGQGSPRGAPLTIGWVGTASNFKYIRTIEKALASVLEDRPSTTLRIVSDVRPKLDFISRSRVEFIPWTEETEVASIQGMDVGLMPLEDSPWARGKCSYKMLQYMSCGIPVVVSPVGMNNDVLRLGSVGLAARSDEEWMSALSHLLDSESARTAMGAIGRQVVQSSFSFPAVVPKLVDAIMSTVR